MPTSLQLVVISFSRVCTLLWAHFCTSAISWGWKMVTVLSRIKNCLISTMGQTKLSDVGLFTIDCPDYWFWQYFSEIKVRIDVPINWYIFRLIRVGSAARLIVYTRGPWAASKCLSVTHVSAYRCRPTCECRTWQFCRVPVTGQIPHCATGLAHTYTSFSPPLPYLCQSTPSGEFENVLTKFPMLKE